jgi:hypothetical protein
MWELEDKKQVLDGRRGNKVQKKEEKENWPQRNEKVTKERGEILNEDGREIGWMK